MNSCYRWALCILAAGPLWAGSAQADNWPSKPIRFLVGYTPGGTTDVIARQVAESVSRDLRVSVVVENRAGAGGIIGATLVATAAPDGYTMLVAASPELAIAPAIGQKTPYKLSDLAPVAFLCNLPHMLVINPSVPAKTVGELVALAKSEPGKLNFASYGTGTSNHLAGELFKARTGVDIVHVPFKGSSAAMTDLLAGRVQMTFDTESAVLPQVKAGTLRPLGFANKTRSKVLPDVPTMDEAGVAGFVAGSWVGLLAPAKTPADIVDKMNKSVNTVLNSPGLRKMFNDRGLSDCSGGTPAQFSAFIGSEVTKWTDVAKRANIHAE